MRVSAAERAAIGVFLSDQKAQAQARRRLQRRAKAEPEKVRAFLATRPVAEIRNNPAMLHLQRIVGE